jgi:hypothetical protein
MTRFFFGEVFGDEEFVMETKAKLGAKAMGRGALENNEGYLLIRIYRVRCFEKIKILKSA